MDSGGNLMTKARDLANGATALSAVSATELAYLDGVTSAVQTQIDGKQAVNAAVSTTELGYLDGVTSAIQTQLDAKTAKSTLTTTGDIYYASAANTPARLGIGSTDQVLKVTGGIPAWATASSGAMTKIASSTFYDVATVDVDNVFTTSYYSYVIKIWVYSNYQATEDLYCRFRYGGTTQTSQYSAGGMRQDRNDASPTAMNSDNSGQWLLSNHMGSADYEMTFLNINLQKYLYNGRTIQFSATGSGPSSDTPAQLLITGGVVANGENYDGFRLLSSSGNISGGYAVYGLQK